ncbi:hypothetical protein DFH11DRAFT_1600391 [Phellopilus nigrolimitatus]|nr:hypothetical protein DFH11DRAFT_1600391 [Phellopilus nigrolimitatus]
MAHFNRPQVPTIYDDKLNDVYTQVEAMLSVSSLSSTATADDLPGAGRILGNLYAFLGRRLETAVSRFMEKRGYGPKAISDGLTKMYKRKERVPIRGTVEYRKHQKKIEKLLKYIRSRYVSNQELALEAILDLAVYDHVRQMLFELDAIRVIGFVSRQAESENCDQLLSPSRKALICLIDTDVNMLGKRLLELDPPLGCLPYIPGGRDRIVEECYIETSQNVLESVLSSPDASFLVIRYLREALCPVPFPNQSTSVPTIIFKCFLHILENAPSDIEWPVFADALRRARWMIRPAFFDNKRLFREQLARSCQNIPCDYKEDLKFYLTDMGK